MKKSNIIIIGVVYPGVEPFLTDYLNSIKNQMDSAFDLLIINDGASEEVQRKVTAFGEMMHIEGSRTPAEIRQIGIEYAISSGYEYIIFSDTDDYFSDNRVTDTKIGLKESPFVFNEIELVDRQGKTLKKKALEGLGVLKSYHNVEAILDRNIFGLSNTACRVSCLHDIEIPLDIVAVDWWIFTVLLINNNPGRFLPAALTYYRQTGTNLIGMGEIPDNKRILQILQIKLLHYRAVAQYCLNHQKDHYARLYDQKFQEMNKLDEKLKDEDFFKEYIQVIRKNYLQIYSGWWSEVLPLSQWSQYEE